MEVSELLTDPTESMGYLEKIEYWGDKVRDSRSPKQFEIARQEYNKLIDGLHGATSHT